MRLDKLIQDVEAKAGVGKVFLAVLACSLLTNMLQAAGFVMMDKSVRTMLVPPEITKSFWVDGKNISPEYLEQMGQHIVMQYASVTPASIESQNQYILKHVHPSVFGELEVRFKAGAQKIKAESLSRFFFPKEVRIAPNAHSVAFIGAVESWIGDKKLPTPEMKAYLVSFEYRDGKVSIKELREADLQNPFAPQKAG